MGVPRGVGAPVGEPAALVGWLRTCRDYDDPPNLGCESVVDETLAMAGDHPDVLVAVAELFDSRGDVAQAHATLDRGWALLPGDRTLRRARKKMGLSVEVMMPSFDE